MPLYEEKLISPFAIRFTQQRIREKFKDGLEVEKTIKEITASAGVGDYDIILDAPFPCIEIIRWAQRGRKDGVDHWFSFDNRRLYCLQRVATEFWPKRVAARAEVLYADAGTIRKKLDSQSQGLCVDIGHAFATEDELQEWSWHKAVQLRAPPGNFALKAEACVAADDAKKNLADLMDVPSSLEKLNLKIETDAKCCDIPEAYPVGQISQSTFDATYCDGAGIAVEPPPGNKSLVGLISQLVQLKMDDGSQVRACSEENAKPEALEDKLQTTTDEFAYVTTWQGDHATPSVDVSTHGEHSLTSLIGQALSSKTEEHTQNHDHVSDDTSSTNFTEHEDIIDSDGGSFASESPARKSRLDEFRCVSGEHSTVQPSLRSNGSPENRQTLPDRKKAKEACKMKPQTQAQHERAAYLAGMQMAQCQMAHWQMAHAMQVANWQRASYAFHACQASHVHGKPGALW
jgi:hypothetical protein